MLLFFVHLGRIGPLSTSLEQSSLCWVQLLLFLALLGLLTVPYVKANYGYSYIRPSSQLPFVL